MTLPAKLMWAGIVVLGAISFAMILPFLTVLYRLSPAAMSFVVNASTIGMAAGGLGVALFSARINRRAGFLSVTGELPDGGIRYP